MFVNNSLYPADNFTMTQWSRLTDTTIFNQVPFGVYAFTSPTEKIPSNDVLPFMYEDTIYIGKSGNSYDDFFYDRKNFDPESNKEKYHRYSIVESRLRAHRNKLRNNELFGKETSYQKFKDVFGCGDNVIDKMNVCVIVPKMVIPNYMVPSWLLFTESYFIYLYQQKFGKNTLMNVGHGETKKIEGSYANNKKLEIKSNSLVGFF